MYCKSKSVTWNTVYARWSDLPLAIINDSDLRPTMPRISSFPDLVFLFLRTVRHGAVLQNYADKKPPFVSIRSRVRVLAFFFVPFGALPSYNDCIMTIAVSIFICGSAKSSRFALLVACTRARLLISCLPIFLLFIFARSSSSAVRNLTHPWLMHCVTFLRAALIIDPHCTSYEFMIALLIGNVDWRLPVFPQSGNFYANYEHAIFYSIPLPINDHALQT